MPTRRTPIILRGIAESSVNQPAIRHGEGGVIAFTPGNATGPASVTDRDVIVRLSRSDLARLLGALPASDLDQDLVDAYLKLRDYLKGDRR